MNRIIPIVNEVDLLQVRRSNAVRQQSRDKDLLG